MNRPSWQSYFIDIAFLTAKRSTCPRRQVGCLIVKDNNIVATGYNGSIIGQSHCIDMECLMENGHCIRTVHAEANAICQAAKLGHSIKDATAYVTSFPCWHCFKLIANAGIDQIYYREEYIISGNMRDIVMTTNVDIFKI